MHVSMTVPTDDLQSVRTMYPELESIGYDRRNAFIGLAGVVGVAVLLSFWPPGHAEISAPPGACSSQVPST